MSKNNKGKGAQQQKNAVKQPEKQVNKPADKKAPKKEEKVNNTETKVEEAEVEVVNQTEANKGMLEHVMNSVGAAPTQHLSPDGCAMLAYVMQRKYMDNPEAKNIYSASFLNGMSAVQDALVIGTVVTEVVSKNTPIALVIRKAAYPQLREMVSEYGIKLPEVNELALPTPEEAKLLAKFGITETEDGQLKIPFTPEDVDDNTKKIIKNEEKVLNKKNVEMDPKKVTTEEQAADALGKIYGDRSIKGGVHKIIVNAIAFVKNFRFAQAERETDVQKKADLIAVLNSRNIQDWLTDAISIREPLLILKSVASALCNTINKDQNPLGAFLTFRSSISTNGECPFTDTDVAAIVKALVNWYIQYMVAVHTDTLNKDKVSKTAKETATAQLEYLKGIKGYMYDFKVEFLDNLISHDADSDFMVKKMYFFTRSQYYGKETGGIKDPESHFENLAYNVQQRVAEIANMFLSEQNKLENMGAQNILELKVASTEDTKPGEGSTEESKGETSKN